MQYTNLGRSGLKVSRLCLGMMTYGDPNWREWVLPGDEGRPFVRRAIEAGINFFDTANMYSVGGSEEITGKLLAEFTRRDEIVIATKVYFPIGDKPNQGGLSRVHIMQAVEDSLRRLNTDYIDLYQIHRWDYTTPIDETLEALHDLVRAGKVRYIGASSMHAWQFSKSLYLADLRGWTRFVSMQNHYNLIYREEEREMMPLCRDQGIGIIPWSPLARGLLAGNRELSAGPQTLRAKTDTVGDSLYGFDQADFDVIERLRELAARRGYSPAQLALAWLLHKEGITAPIVGASKMKHLDEAIAAVEISLSEKEIHFLEERYQPHPVSGHH
ncbi:MAG: aldo/keto reductase [Anaerolineae bacterium]|nr:aldo/keto reductase [Anaerolineae bacterium]MBL6965306.1 aldo/keto reductase [Anaerolineales bacterium]